jgi:uncharacterized membrane protein (DUF485 family)
LAKRRHFFELFLRQNRVSPALDIPSRMPFLAQPIGAGVTSLGIPIGMGVIVFTIVITAIYVRRANSEFDELTAAILKDVSK